MTLSEYPLYGPLECIAFVPLIGQDDHNIYKENAFEHNDSV